MDMKGKIASLIIGSSVLVVTPCLIAWSGDIPADDSRAEESNPSVEAGDPADDDISEPEVTIRGQQQGQVKDGDYITVPSGTMSHWLILVAPAKMGREEHNSEGDNALLRFECYTTRINDYTWQVTAKYKYKFWNDAHKNGIWYPGRANFIIVPKG